MTVCPLSVSRDDLDALRQLIDPWKSRDALAPSTAALRRADRMAHDIEISLQQDTLHADSRGTAEARATRDLEPAGP